MTTSLILAFTALAVTFMLCLAAGRAWRGWLELKRLELVGRAGPEAETEAVPGEDMALRIELAAVRERLRKLEEIASGVEL
jgi:hypothetical protein